MFAKRLKELRKSKGLTQIAFANIFCISNGAVGNWEIGTRQPDHEMLTRIADYFHVSTDYLLGRTNDASRPSPDFSPGITEDYTSFPVIGDVAAGYNHIATEDWEGEKIDVPNSYLKGRPKEEFFVLKVKGDSMYPAYQDGDHVLVLRQATLDYSGQVGVIVYNDDNATLKKVEFKQGEDWLRLVPINPTHPSIRVENEDLEHCHVLGVPRLLLREIQD